MLLKLLYLLQGIVKDDLEREVLTQIDAANIRIGEDVFGIALGQYVAIVDNVGVFADVKGFSDIVVGNQYAYTAIFKVADNALNVIHRNGVNAGKGLVEEYKSRLHRQCAGNFDTPPLTTR